MEVHAGPRHRATVNRVERLGGTEGNQILTSSVAGILTVLLIAEGITILEMGGLLSAHMFIGLVLVPPVMLKLASTGYRFARYYGGARAYREKGPPALPMRLLAPILVAMTIGVFATGIWLLALGHKSDQVLLLHKVTFIIWGAVFAIHFLVYAPRALKSMRRDWAFRSGPPGSRVRPTRRARRRLTRRRRRARDLSDQLDQRLAWRSLGLTLAVMEWTSARILSPTKEDTMGFDQYHEPADELSAETRTFARMIASLTEEAEAIGWYEQRMSVEPDKDAKAIMENAQSEEFKHFAMDLEFLIRRTEKWRIALKTTLFTDGDIVEAGERAEEAEGLG